MARKTIATNIAYDDSRKKYYVTFHYGKGIKTVKTYTSKAEAFKALKQFEADKANEEVTLPSKETFGDWLTYWLQNVVGPNLRPTTLNGYTNIIRKHIIPALGSIELQKLSAADIRAYYQQLQSGSDALSQNSVRKHHELIHHALGDAVAEEKIRKNPARIVTPPKKKPISYTIYTPQELSQLFELVKGDRMEIVVKLAGYYGMRREEICGLMWDDIDFDRNVFEIRRAMTSFAGQIVIGEPKTNASYRKEALNDDVRELLLRLREEQDKNKKLLADDYQDTGFVLCRADGLPYRPNYVSSLFTQFIDRHGLKRIHLHELRHTFASIASEVGVPMFNISKALGHGSAAITSGIYTHIFDDTHKETIDRVTEAIRKFQKG